VNEVFSNAELGRVIIFVPTIALADYARSRFEELKLNPQKEFITNR
jgi:hypothetical protein